MKHALSFLFLAAFIGALFYLFSGDPSADSSAATSEQFSGNNDNNSIPAKNAVDTKADSLPALPDSLKNESQLLVAWKSKYRMRLYYKGEIQKTYIIALGQSPIGPKEKQGDNKTPEGDYRIIQKSKGPFSGDYSQYLGVTWMRLNYPNNADAINGFRNGSITETQLTSILTANNAGKEPPKNTALGGGIGFHGWWNEWPEADRQNLTWGCISLQNTDLNDLYDRVDLKTRVVILP
ncbi:MAG TPA: L,D-transpeptidase family protein [Bacteroidia bacterium]|jgi:lipoprotein-anchoring transpeptidase ErfK/SrfK|nr:L,D-transpeptidase family protein [Bacteroidia bacterium]